MADDKTNVGEPDRSRVAGDQDYELRYLADKFGLSQEQARDDRVKLEEEARKYRGRS